MGSAIQSFNPLVFANLNSFEVAKELLDKHKHRIEPLLDVIQKHGLSDAIGVTLLHKHHNLFADEYLVRQQDGNVIKTKPESFLPTGSVPCVWGFAKAFSQNQQLDLYPVEFLSSSAKTAKEVSLKSVAAVENDDFRAEYLAALEKYDVADLFGLSLVTSDLFDLKNSETLYETSNGRSSTLAPINASDVNKSDSTQTLWLGKPSITPSIICISHCGAHCKIHCAIHCGMHCRRHNVA
ncbi:MAG: hypothetical protein V4650_14420 [Pseudomonadota bacterium]